LLPSNPSITSQGVQGNRRLVVVHRPVIGVVVDVVEAFKGSAPLSQDLQVRWWYSNRVTINQSNNQSNKQTITQTIKQSNKQTNQPTYKQRNKYNNNNNNNKEIIRCKSKKNKITIAMQ
jgi:hypothetical protein